MSNFIVPIVKIEKVERHPNADTLSLTEAEGCPVTIRTGDFSEGDLAIYVPIEAVVAQDGAAGRVCTFLKYKSGKHRVKAMRLRGIFSMGVLLKTHDFFTFDPPIGADVGPLLGITKFEEPEHGAGHGGGTIVSGRSEADPGWAPTYGVDHYRKHKTWLTPGEEVVVTEKIHGCNFRATFHQDRLWVASHHTFRQEDEADTWWSALRAHGLDAKLRHPLLVGKILYGEIYGPVQDLKYGSPDAVQFAAFDVYDIRSGRFLAYDAACEILNTVGVPLVPVIYRGAYDPALVEPLADGRSTIAPEQIREGIVVRTVKEHPRVVLKLVGESYLLRKDGTERH